MIRSSEFEHGLNILSFIASGILNPEATSVVVFLLFFYNIKTMIKNKTETAKL